MRHGGIAAAAVLLIAAAGFYFSPAGWKLRSRARWFVEDPWGGARPTLWRDSLRMALPRPARDMVRKSSPPPSPASNPRRWPRPIPISSRVAAQHFSRRAGLAGTPRPADPVRPLRGGVLGRVHP